MTQPEDEDTYSGLNEADMQQVLEDVGNLVSIRIAQALPDAQDICRESLQITYLLVLAVRLARQHSLSPRELVDLLYNSWEHVVETELKQVTTELAQVRGAPKPHVHNWVDTGIAPGHQTCTSCGQMWQLTPKDPEAELQATQSLIDSNR